MMTLPNKTSERPVETWTSIPLADFAEKVAGLGTSRNAGSRGPVVVSVDGRGGSGKSTLGRNLTEALRGTGHMATLIATDDLAWHAPFFGWAPETLEMLLRPLSSGAEVDFVPAAWKEKGRQGSIVVPGSTEFVVFEGVGASQRAFTGMVDVSIWVQSDFKLARTLGIARDLETGVNGDEEQTAAFWDEWQSHELPFLEQDKPWDRADFVVAGNGPRPLQHDAVSFTTSV